MHLRCKRDGDEPGYAAGAGHIVLTAAWLNQNLSASFTAVGSPGDVEADFGAPAECHRWGRGEVFI